MFDISTNRCDNCGGEQTIIGRSVKCFDCGLCHGEDPTTDRAMLAVGNDLLTLGHKIHVTDEDLPDDVFEYERLGEIRRVRCTTIVTDDPTTARPPLQPGIHPSLFEGVEEVGVLFVDRNQVVRYEACPYIERTYATESAKKGCIRMTFGVSDSVDPELAEFLESLDTDGPTLSEVLDDE